MLRYIHKVVNAFFPGINLQEMNDSYRLMYITDLKCKSLTCTKGLS